METATTEDVLRIIRRDFAPEVHDDVRELLNQYSGPDSAQRVQLAILKLSNGNLDAVRKHLAIAQSDFRDVIAPAEYPDFWKIGFVGVDRLTANEVKALKQRDRRQYQKWLTRR